MKQSNSEEANPILNSDYHFDYSREPRRDIAFVDMKSFYASVECLNRGLKPLSACLCVMSTADNSGGLILASSPTFKWAFGKHNVSRSRDLPFDVHTRKFNWYKWNREHASPWKTEIEQPDPSYVAHVEYWASKTVFAPPSMGEYIKVNGRIQKAIHEEIAPYEDCFWYSIDEGFIDLTGSLNYHVSNDEEGLSRSVKLDLVSKKLQRVIYDATDGIVSTVGMSNSNPLLAKLALDNYAKQEPTMRALINYEDVPEKVWTIEKMTDFWGIGERTEKNLAKFGIHSIKELARANPDELKKKMGVIGVQLYCHANGIDESYLYGKPYRPKNRSIGNSTTLPRDYYHQASIMLVIRELAEQVAIRLRRIHQEATTITLYVGYSLSEGKRAIHCSRKIEPTNNTRRLCDAIADIFLDKYESGGVRRLGVTYSNLIAEPFHLISLFDEDENDFYHQEKENQLQDTIDSIRQQYGFTKLLKASALTKDSRLIKRSKQIGGHSAGGLDGLQ
ncbi:DNA polymerase [Lactococcus fujiensis]|uniref:DNA-directed DNA polymerase n=1 Tax=Lactococcus fujiensis JCM 16395 TaxID=1291764 RepID=A0A2A5RNH3_9LACT|nr:DNA polymerase [Lactococcus fujiensis]PCS00868.1 DNA-directed DNA polymerase [Lactococcus fujiensis JCM 16395]